MGAAFGMGVVREGAVMKPVMTGSEGTAGAVTGGECKRAAVSNCMPAVLVRAISFLCGVCSTAELLLSEASVYLVLL